MKKPIFLFNLFILIGLTFSAAIGKEPDPDHKRTFCNPMDLNYRFNFRSEPP
jgi:hypothetical protein